MPSGAFDAAERRRVREPVVKIELALRNVAHREEGTTVTGPEDSADFPVSSVIDGERTHLDYGPPEGDGGEGLPAPDDGIGRKGWKSTFMGHADVATKTEFVAATKTRLTVVDDGAQISGTTTRYEQDFDLLDEDPLAEQDDWEQTVGTGGTIEVTGEARHDPNVSGQGVRLTAGGTTTEKRDERPVTPGTGLLNLAIRFRVVTWGEDADDAAWLVLLQNGGAGAGDRLRLVLDSGTRRLRLDKGSGAYDTDIPYDVQLGEWHQLVLRADRTDAENSPIRLLVARDGEESAVEVHRETLSLAGINRIGFRIARGSGGTAMVADVDTLRIVDALEEDGHLTHDIDGGAEPLNDEGELSFEGESHLVQQIISTSWRSPIRDNDASVVITPDESTNKRVAFRFRPTSTGVANGMAVELAPVASTGVKFPVMIADQPEGTLVGHYRFEEASGTTLVDETATQNGTISGTPTYQEPDRWDSFSLKFPTASAYATIPYHAGLAWTSEEWTMMFSVRVTALPGLHVLLDAGGMRIECYDEGGGAILSVTARSVSGATAVVRAAATGLDDGEHHLVWVTYRTHVLTVGLDGHIIAAQIVIANTVTLLSGPGAPGLVFPGFAIPFFGESDWTLARGADGANGWGNWIGEFAAWKGVALDASFFSGLVAEGDVLVGTTVETSDKQVRLRLYAVEDDEPGRLLSESDERIVRAGDDPLTVTFAFPRPSLVRAYADYAVEVVADEGDADDRIGLRVDSTSPGYAGGGVWISNDGSTWAAVDTTKAPGFAARHSVQIETFYAAGNEDDALPLHAPTGGAEPSRIAFKIDDPYAHLARGLQVLIRRAGAEGGGMEAANIQVFIAPDSPEPPTDAEAVAVARGTKAVSEIEQEDAGEFIATGGDITDVEGDKVHTFNSSGTFTVTGSGSVDALVIAGGGGGGGNVGGGGGAGGYLEVSDEPVTAQGYTITVGAGGAGGVASGAADGSNGGNSSALGYTATGGGGGSGYSSGAGANGGSGGGGSGNNAAGGTGTAGQGNDGGDGQHDGSDHHAGGGGGGAGAAGQDAPAATQGGAGGAGTASSITGSSVTRAGGGGGGGYQASGGVSPGAGGAGGGGAGHATINNPGVAGTDNTGGGGGGGAGGGGSPTGGAGGSGVVIIRYTPRSGDPSRLVHVPLSGLIPAGPVWVELRLTPWGTATQHEDSYLEIGVDTSSPTYPDGETWSKPDDDDYAEVAGTFPVFALIGDARPWFRFDVRYATSSGGLATADDLAVSDNPARLGSVAGMILPTGLKQHVRVKAEAIRKQIDDPPWTPTLDAVRTTIRNVTDKTLTLAFGQPRTVNLIALWGHPDPIRGLAQRFVIETKTNESDWTAIATWDATLSRAYRRGGGGAVSFDDADVILIAEGAVLRFAEVSCTHLRVRFLEGLEGHVRLMEIEVRQVVDVSRRLGRADVSHDADSLLRRIKARSISLTLNNGRLPAALDATEETGYLSSEAGPLAGLVGAGARILAWAGYQDVPGELVKLGEFDVDDWDESAGSDEIKVSGRDDAARLAVKVRPRVRENVRHHEMMEYLANLAGMPSQRMMLDSTGGRIDVFGGKESEAWGEIQKLAEAVNFGRVWLDEDGYLRFRFTGHSGGTALVAAAPKMNSFTFISGYERATVIQSDFADRPEVVPTTEMIARSKSRAIARARQTGKIPADAAVISTSYSFSKPLFTWHLTWSRPIMVTVAATPVPVAVWGPGQIGPLEVGGGERTWWVRHSLLPSGLPANENWDLMGLDPMSGDVLVLPIQAAWSTGERGARVVLIDGLINVLMTRTSPGSTYQDVVVWSYSGGQLVTRNITGYEVPRIKGFAQRPVQVFDAGDVLLWTTDHVDNRKLVACHSSLSSPDVFAGSPGSSGTTFEEKDVDDEDPVRFLGFAREGDVLLGLAEVVRGDGTRYLGLWELAEPGGVLGLSVTATRVAVIDCPNDKAVRVFGVIGTGEGFLYVLTAPEIGTGSPAQTAGPVVLWKVTVPGYEVTTVRVLAEAGGAANSREVEALTRADGQVLIGFPAANGERRLAVYTEATDQLVDYGPISLGGAIATDFSSVPSTEGSTRFYGLNDVLRPFEIQAQHETAEEQALALTLTSEDAEDERALAGATLRAGPDRGGDSRIINAAIVRSKPRTVKRDSSGNPVVETVWEAQNLPWSVTARTYETQIELKTECLPSSLVALSTTSPPLNRIVPQPSFSSGATGSAKLERIHGRQPLLKITVDQPGLLTGLRITGQPLEDGASLLAVVTNPRSVSRYGLRTKSIENPYVYSVFAQNVLAGALVRRYAERRPSITGVQTTRARLALPLFSRVRIREMMRLKVDAEFQVVRIRLDLMSLTMSLDVE